MPGKGRGRVVDLTWRILGCSADGLWAHPRPSPRQLSEAACRRGQETSVRGSSCGSTATSLGGRGWWSVPRVVKYFIQNTQFQTRNDQANRSDPHGSEQAGGRNGPGGQRPCWTGRLWPVGTAWKENSTPTQQTHSPSRTGGRHSLSSRVDRGSGLAVDWARRREEKGEVNGASGTRGTGKAA